MMEESQIVIGDLSARADDDEFDDVMEAEDSDNGPDGLWSAGEFDGADSPEGYQTAKNKSTV